jgi:hypothetical protein
MAELNRNDYYYTLIDSRQIFTGYGRYLQLHQIENDTIEDYENYLLTLEDEKYIQEKESEVNDINNNVEYYSSRIRQNNDEYLEFINFLLEQEDWSNELVIIKGEIWDEFYSTDDEEYEMKMEYCDAKSFYEKFAEITETNIEEFETNFISSKYIDTYTYNTMNLIIKINGTSQRFIIDAV